MGLPEARSHAHLATERTFEDRLAARSDPAVESGLFREHIRHTEPQSYEGGARPAAVKGRESDEPEDSVAEAVHGDVSIVDGDAADLERDGVPAR